MRVGVVPKWLVWGNRSPWTTVLVILILLALTLVFYWKIAFLGRILVSYDLFTYFYPYRDFAAQSLSQGNLPLWNPYLFSGAPFLANIQTAVLYPLNLLVLPLEAPQAINLSILIHVFLAGLFMFSFASTSLRLDRLSASVAAIVFMFSGFMSQQVGHINQLNASVWLPLLFLLLELANRRNSLRLALLGGVVMATQILAGHPQETYLSATGLVLFALFLVIRRLSARNGEQSGPIIRLSTWGGLRAGLASIGLLLTLLLVGAGLTAFQLLPTQELSAESIRSGGLSYQEATSFSLPPQEILRSLLPGFHQNPFSEYIAYVGILPLSLAALSFWRRRNNPYTLLALALVLVGMFLALGGYNPLYHIAYRLVPGFDLFRVPARWLFLYTFGISLVAGIGINSLGRNEKAPNSLTRGNTTWAKAKKGIRKFIIAYIIVVGLVGSASPWLILPRPKVLLLWGSLLGLGLLAITAGRTLLPGKRLKIVIALVVVAELFFASRSLDLNRPTLPQAYSSLRPTITQLSLDKTEFRILSLASPGYVPGDARELREILSSELSPDLVEDLLISTKYKEVLAPNLSLKYGIATIDGYDGGVLPLKRYVEFKQLLLDSGGLMTESLRRDNHNQPDAVLRDQLAGIPDTKLLGALNIKYIITDKRHDPWVDNVYFDLASTLAIGGSTAKMKLDNLPALETTSLGIISYLSGGESLPESGPVAKIRVTDSKSNEFSFLLRAGVDTAEGEYAAKQSDITHKPARLASLWESNQQANNYYTKLSFGRPIYPKEIWFEYLQPAGQLHLRGISLIDDRTSVLGGFPVSEALVLNRRLQLVHSGDLKIYENLDWLPRAFLVQQVEVKKTKEATLAALRTGFREKVVLPEQNKDWEIPSVPQTAQTVPKEEVKLVVYEPERVIVEATLRRAGFLVLTDSYYPGWRVWIDDKEGEILRADHLLRSVYLSEGRHLIEFRYMPDSFRLGMLITLATAGLTALGLLIGNGRNLNTAIKPLFKMSNKWFERQSR